MANVEGASNSKKQKTSTAQKAQNAKKKYDKAKKTLETLKNVKALAPLITALGTVAIVVLIILLIIGFIGFFVTLPGLAIDKILEACENFWRWAVGDESIEIKDQDVDNLANYIQDMGYDLVGYGFISPGKVTNDESTGKITVDWENSELQNLYGYILANERTYTTQGLSYGLLSTWFSSYSITGNLISRLNQAVRNNWNVSDPEKYGMLDFSEDVIESVDVSRNWFSARNLGSNKSVVGAYEVEIDRAKNEMKITSKTGILGLDRDQVKWSLEGWTSRYGKPIELSMALHLSTMAPDFVYNFCTNSDLQTRVILKTKAINYKYTYKYQHTQNGVAVGEPTTSEEVIQKFENMNTQQIERMNKIFANGPYIEKDDDTTKYLNIKPIYSILESLSKDNKKIDTSIISVSSNDSNTEFYAAVDNNGNPICFNVQLSTRFTVSFKSDGQPVFTVVQSNTPNSFNLGDLIRGKSFTNGKTIRIEFLSIEDLIMLASANYMFYGFSRDEVKRSLSYPDGTSDLVREAAGLGNSNYEGVIPCLVLLRYQNFFDAVDNIINPNGEEGILSEKYREKAEKLDLNIQFNTYFTEEKNITELVYVRDETGALKRDENGNLIQETRERKIKKIKVGKKIGFDTPIENGHLVGENGNEIKHNAGDMWSAIYNHFKNDENAQINDLRDMLWGTEGEDGFLDFIQEEIHQIKFTEGKTKDSIDINDENYLKMLVLFSEDLEGFITPKHIDENTFIKLYYVFKSLKTNILAWKPYIDRVVNHWYKDLKFSYDFNAVNDNSSVTKEFNPEGNAEDPRMSELEQRGKFYYEETIEDGSSDIKQDGQPEIIKTESWHYMVKNWFLYGYYFIYDTTPETAEKIEKARKILSKDSLIADGYSETEAERLTYNKNNPLLINVSSQENLYGNGNQEIDKKAKELNEILKNHDDEVNGVRLKKINFEKKEALDAFSILEGMHTKDSEYIYRDLKEFLIELGYFTRSDFEEIETDVFQWIIPKYQVYKDEWPDPKFEKNNTEYGTYVRSASSLEEQREDIAEEAKNSRKPVTNSSISGYFTTSGDGYNSVTEVNGVYYKNFKQAKGSYANKPYYGSDMANAGCGPTSAAIMLSGYGMDTSPYDVAQIITNKYGDITSKDNLVAALNDLNFKVTGYRVNGTNDQAAITAIEKALEKKPVMVAGNFGGYIHWICLIGIENGEAIISDPAQGIPVLNALVRGNNGYITVKDLVEKYIYGGSYIIPEKEPNGVVIKQSVQGFKKDLDIIAPEKGKIIEDETSEEEPQTPESETEESEQEEKDYFKTNGNYVIIEFTEDNGVKGWKMKIEGIKDRTVSKGDTVTKGQKIGVTDEDNIKIILYDDKDAIINDVEDYFKLKKRKTQTNYGTGDLEQLGVMILTMEGGMDSNSDGDYWIAIEGNGDWRDITAGGSGITNSCEQQFKETGHGDLWPMQVGDRVPKSAILEVMAKVLEEQYASINSIVEKNNANLTEPQKLALTSLAYNTGNLNEIEEIINTYIVDADKAKWMFLNICHAGGDVLLGLQYRRAVEWDIFENGGNFEYSESRKTECFEKYYTNFYYTTSY